MDTQAKMALGDFRRLQALVSSETRKLEVANPVAPSDEKLALNYLYKLAAFPAEFKFGGNTEEEAQFVPTLALDQMEQDSLLVKSMEGIISYTNFMMAKGVKH